MNLKYTDQQITDAVAKSISICGVLTLLGIRLSSGSHRNIKLRIQKLGVDVSHFKGKGSNIGQPSPKRKTADEILILRTSGRRLHAYKLRRALFEKNVPYICAKCGCDDNWHGEKIVLEVDHKNNNWLDDRIENLEFLCPNCHSLRKHRFNQGLTSLTTRRRKVKNESRRRC